MQTGERGGSQAVTSRWTSLPPGGIGEIYMRNRNAPPRMVYAGQAPRRMHEACKAALLGDWAEARTIDASLQPLHKDLFVEASPIPVKWAVARMGLIGNAIRLPLVELSAAHQDTVLRAMQAAGVTLEDQAA